MIPILIISCTIFQLAASFTYTAGGTLGRKTSFLHESNDDNNEKRLLDVLMQKGNPELQHIHMPFIEPLGNNYIDCKMAFGVNVNDVPCK